MSEPALAEVSRQTQPPKKPPTAGPSQGDRSRLNDACVTARIVGTNPQGHGLVLDLELDPDLTVLKGAKGWIEHVRDSGFVVTETGIGRAKAITTFHLKPEDLAGNTNVMISCEATSKPVGKAIEARVIGRQSKGNEVVLLLAAGRAQGVRENMKGRFVDVPGGSFDVTDVSDTVCKAVTQLTHDQVLAYVNVEGGGAPRKVVIGP